MKIGILTFHAQTNYGGVLQAVALAEVLKSIGHEVFIFNKRMVRDYDGLAPIRPPKDFIGFLKYLFRLPLALGDFSETFRRAKTREFLKNHVCFSPYEFYEWSEIKAKIDADLIVVGSDQVWRCVGDGLDPRPYFLDGAPKDIPAIAYAASIGMQEIPEKFKPWYAEGLRRFSAISCREERAAEIVRSFGFPAEHVVDPTLLNAERFADEYPSTVSGDRKLVCYFVHTHLSEALPILKKFAKREKCKVEVYQAVSYRNFPRGDLKSLLRELTLPLRMLVGGVRFMSKAGPEDFLKAMSSATWVITDSFHGTMFSTIFRRNFRVLSPQDELASGMFHRMREFVGECVSGEVFISDLADAVRSLAQEPEPVFDEIAIARKIKFSRDWLRNAVGVELKR